MTSSATISTDLLHFLKQPESYPHGPDHVEHIQTHISHVFIAPPYVYKIKKPVDFGFLDYGTLELRKHFCEQEIDLNRRLCAGIYLSVIPISRKGDSFIFGSEEQESVAEYAVHMKKLSEKNLLSEKVKNRSLTTKHLDRVADKLTAFYMNQESGADILTWGDPERIKTNTDENFQQTQAFIGKTIEEPAYEAIKHYTDGYLKHQHNLFQKRIKEQRIIDGHGDLHLEHIHVSDSRVCIYDCIEFNKRFRYQDLAGDLAYLAMDLDFNGLWASGRYFINHMSEQLDDPDLQQVVDFYKCYRAYVKGKIKSLQSEEEEVTEKDRDHARKLASAYFSLSLRYALLGTRPVALVFMGLPGSGKSTLAQKLSEKLDLNLYSSDTIRKEIAGLPPDKRTPEEKREQLYSRQISEKTYNKLLEKALEHIQTDESVVLDATFSARTDRQNITEQLESHEARYYFIETRAPAEVLRNRLRERDHRQHVISDVRIEDFEKLRGRYDTPGEVEPEHLLAVETHRSFDESKKQLYLQLAGTNMK